MRSIIAAIALTLVAPTVYAAGPHVMATARTCKAQNNTLVYINGITSITADIHGDTGTATPSTLPLCSGTVTVNAGCYGGTGGSYGQVYLKINGTNVQTLTCAVGETKSNVTLSWPVSGRYTVDVFGIAVGDSDFSANGYSLPVAQ